MKDDIGDKSPNELSFWWVNQGKTQNKVIEAGYLWAPQTNKIGTPLAHHILLKEAKVEDLVFCYADTQIKYVGVVTHLAEEATKPKEIAESDWDTAGYKLKLKYYKISPSITKDEIPQQWRLDEGSPFDVNGNLIQGYFYSLTKKFTSKLYEKFQDRFPSEIRNKLIAYQGTKEVDNEVAENHGLYKNDKELINHIYSYIQSKGFFYQKEEISNLYLSLRSKPFIILSGISGTGKTKMAQLFAESLGATDDNEQFKLIPVRPDWNDGSDLLGYVDIKGDFKEGPLTRVIKAAAEKPELPYFVLLDEMNLARVEHYFSDILSVMESRKWEDGKVVSSNLLNEETAGFNLQLPNNLYIIGTVNMDETTYPFSKKVLDRANTIEFNQVELDNFAFLNEVNDIAPIQVSNEVLVSRYLHLKDAYSEHKQLIERVTNELIRINNVLEKNKSHVGYRVRDEIIFYMAHNDNADLFDEQAAFDHCILQKILPRIGGSDSSVEELLRDLYEIFTGVKFDEDHGWNESELETTKYPKSTKKVVEMHRRLRDGYTSFWLT